MQRARAYRIAAGGKRYQLLRGEFHRHTEISSHRDQDGPFEEIWHPAAHRARVEIEIQDERISPDAQAGDPPVRR